MISPAAGKVLFSQSLQYNSSVISLSPPSSSPRHRCLLLVPHIVRRFHYRNLWSGDDEQQAVFGIKIWELKGKLDPTFQRPPVKLRRQHSNIRFSSDSQYTFFSDQVIFRRSRLGTISTAGKADDNNIPAINFFTNLSKFNGTIKKNHRFIFSQNQMHSFYPFSFIWSKFLTIWRPIRPVSLIYIFQSILLWFLVILSWLFLWEYCLLCYWFLVVKLALLYIGSVATGYTWFFLIFPVDLSHFYLCVFF